MARIGVGLDHSIRGSVRSVTEELEHGVRRPPADLPAAVGSELGAFIADVRRSPAAEALLLAIARRNAILATAVPFSRGTVRELVALETGTFDSRTLRQPGPSRAAIAALELLETAGTRERGAAPLDDARLPEEMLTTLAALQIVPHSAALPGDPHPAAAPADSERNAIATIQRTRELVGRLTARHESDRLRIDTLGKAAASSHRVHGALERWPIASVALIIDATGLQVQAVTSALYRLRGLGIAREITRRHRHRLFCYDAWLALLDDDVASWLDERGDRR